MTTKTTEERPTVLLIAKSAFAAAPHAEMARISDLVAERQSGSIMRYAFTEQGTPSLKEALLDIVASGSPRLTIVPLLLPMEPSFLTWLKKAVRRWRSESGKPWPDIAITDHVAASAMMADLVTGLVETASPFEPGGSPAAMTEGSLVPAQKRRVLVCQGGPCNAAGAVTVWCHLRNQQERLKLRTAGDGTMTAKSTCLGPCSLAPVMQVFPEGTYYGGIDEAATDRIIEEHLLGGNVVEDFAYHPTGRKQRLRARSPIN